MEMEKRIYSLNLIAFLYSQGHKEVRIGRDENNNKAYFVFSDENKEVENAIQRYRHESHDLHTFLNCYKEVRAKIKKIINY